MKAVKVKIVFTILFLFGAISLFSQDELQQRGTIPDELLRPRRDEAPRYPIDIVIGTLGRGSAPSDAYEVARRAASAFLAGNMDDTVFSSVNRVFLESCMSALNVINPRLFRLGGGREEPDGSVSFLVRFSGRDEGITGELFVRLVQQTVQPTVQPAVPPIIQPQNVPPASDAETENEFSLEDEDNEHLINEHSEVEIPVEVTPVAAVPARRIWVFEDLILEEPRSRELENAEDRKRFDFSPYERLY